MTKELKLLDTNVGEALEKIEFALDATPQEHDSIELKQNKQKAQSLLKLLRNELSVLAKLTR